MENNKRKTQCDRLLDFLKEKGSITNYDALMELGIFSCAKRICELKNYGNAIVSKWEHRENRYGEKVKCKRYYLVVCVE